MKPSILAIGDIITAPSSGLRTYVDLLQQEAEELGIASVLTWAAPDRTSATLRTQIEAVAESLDDAPLVVTLMVGSMDHAVPPGGAEPYVDLPSYEANVKAILESIASWPRLKMRPHGGPAIVVLLPPFCMTGTNRRGLGLSQARLEAYCRTLSREAEAIDALVVDLNTIFGTSLKWSDDRLCRVWTEGGDGLRLNSIAHKLIYPYVRGAVSHCVS